MNAYGWGDKMNPELKRVRNTTKYELYVLWRMRTGGLYRRVLSGILIREGVPSERRNRRPLAGDG